MLSTTVSSRYTLRPVAPTTLSPSGSPAEVDARVAVEGDTVTVRYKCMNNKGEASFALAAILVANRHYDIGNDADHRNI